MVKEYSIPSATGQCDIYVKVWEPETPPRAVLQIVHGMAEHIQRYEDFAGFMNAHGILVTGCDLPGHGKSLDKDGTLGYFGPENGWTHLIEDLRGIYAATKAEYPGTPYILMGHSMGSFLARTYAGRHGDMDAYIFSGTAGKNPALPVAKLIADSAIKKNGGKEPNEKLNNLSFGSYNKAFKPNRTAFDWLSRDNAEVDKYVEDPLCGFVFTSSAFRDLFDGLTEIQDKKWAERVPKKPVLFISGSLDPVGGKAAAGVREVSGNLIATGHDVQMNIYPDARHELLNELNKRDVYQDVLQFIENVIP